MSKKFFTQLATLILVAVFVSACGTSPATSTETASENTASDTATEPAAAEEPVTIVWWQLTGNDAQVAAWNEIIAAFEAANPGIKISLETRAIDAQKEALRVAAGTDAFPDIYFMWSGLGLGGEFVSAGMSAPLDEYYAKYGWDTRLTAPALGAAQQYGDGHYHGVMSEIHGQALYYRKDAFEAAGITAEPTTFDELIAANEKLVAASYSPIEFGGTVNWHLMRLLDNFLETKCGVETHNQIKALEASWATTPCVAEAFSELKLWSDQYIVPDFIGISNDESTQLLYAGTAAMALEGDWMNAVFPTQDQDPNDYGLFLFPTGTGRLYAFAQGNYIGANSQHKDEAAAFLDFFSSDEIQSKYLGTFGSISVAKNAVAASPTELDTEWASIFADATGSFQNADQAFSLEITTEYWRIQNLVATGEMDPAVAGAEFQKFIDSHK